MNINDYIKRQNHGVAILVIFNIFYPLKKKKDKPFLLGQLHSNAYLYKRDKIRKYDRYALLTHRLPELQIQYFFISMTFENHEC